MTSATLLLFAALAACSWPTDQRAALPAGALVIDPQAPLDTALGMSADTYLRQGHPNHNAGTDTLLRVRADGHNRALLQVDPAALAAATGGGTLLAARLELTITTNADNWGPDGREIALHRLTTAWTELGATWNCAVDSVPGNQQAECAGPTAWEMGAGGPNPWVATPTATLTMTNELSGVVTFDVTADVAAWLGGTLNAGWIVKKVNEGATGRVEFGSRESASPPRLVLTVRADTSRPAVPSGFKSPDSTEALLVSPPGDDSVLVLRNFIHIEFDDGTSGSTVAAVLAKYSAEVAGGFPLTGTYIVRIPDPGPTYGALDSVMAAVRLEQGVRAVYRYVYKEPIRNPSRYPVDGGMVQRADWLSGQGTDGTRALRAIRAPLAWGCENGVYGGGDPIAIGIVDDLFEQVTDLTGMFDTTLSVDTTNWSLWTDTLPDVYQSHGTGVAGVMTARGDNNQDVTGLLWRSALHLFPLSVQTSTGVHAVQNRGAYLRNVVIPSAAAADIKLLHSSIEATPDTALATAIARAIAAFLTSSAEGRLFVQASDNLRLDLTPSQADVQGALMTQVAVRLAADPSARDRFIHVGAANRDGTGIWDDGPDSGATLITGVTDILAPGEDILTLVRPQDYNQQTTRLSDGTSFAGPMVSGVAGLLWAFDSTLTADSVRDYILRGAREPKTVDGAGQPVPPTPISNSGLYLLDAYGALTLAAREDSTRPVCGFPVYTRAGQVLFERVAGNPQVRSAPGDSLSDVTVAQGGRLLAATSWGTTSGVVEFNHLGTQQGSILPLRQRVFLERDTLDVSSAVNPVLTMWRPHDTVTIDLADRLGALQPFPLFLFDLAASPAGDWMSASVFYQESLTQSRFGLYLVQVDPAQTLTVQETAFEDFQPDPCETSCWEPTGAHEAGWTLDGQRLVLGLAQFQLVGGDLVLTGTGLRNVTVTAGVPTGYGTQAVPLSGVQWFSPRFTADGAVLSANQLSGSACTTQARTAATLAALGSPTTADPADCSATDPRRVFNSPPPIAAAQGQARVLQSLLEHWRPGTSALPRATEARH